MKADIIILTNTFPFRGETFLKTEVDVLPDYIKADIFPFFAPEQSGETFDCSVPVHVFDSSISLSKKVLAAFYSAKNLFCKNEIREALNKKGRFRNLLKALKFAYISELRVQHIRKLIEKMGNTQFLFYSYWMYEIAYVGARLKELFPGSLFVTRCHGYDLYAERHKNGYLPYRHFILDSADRVYPISLDGKDYLSKLYSGKYDHKTSVARLGTLRLFEIKKPKEENRTVIVSCSNLIAVKRVHLIIEALSAAKKNITWIHFGDGKLRAELEEKAKKLPGNIHVEFKGHTPNADIQKYYSSHNITAFVNVSESEGVPVSIMEALSYGIPVIATDVGGTSELVHHNENGVLLNEDFSSEELLSAIDYTQANHEALGNNAQQTWKMMCDARATTKQFYYSLLQLEAK